MREVEEKDYPIIYQIALDCFDHNVAVDRNYTLARIFFKRYFTAKKIKKRLQENSVIYVYEEDNVLGFVEIEDTDYISNVFVSPDCQGKGIGRKLMACAEDYCKSRHKKKFILKLDASKDAIPFYKHLGYTLLDKMHSSLGVELYAMQKEIN